MRNIFQMELYMTAVDNMNRVFIVTPFGIKELLLFFNILPEYVRGAPLLNGVDIVCGISLCRNISN